MAVGKAAVQSTSIEMGKCGNEQVRKGEVEEVVHSSTCINHGSPNRPVVLLP